MGAISRTGRELPTEQFRPEFLLDFSGCSDKDAQDSGSLKSSSYLLLEVPTLRAAYRSLGSIVPLGARIILGSAMS